MSVLLSCNYSSKKYVGENRAHTVMKLMDFQNAFSRPVMEKKSRILGKIAEVVEQS